MPTIAKRRRMTLIAGSVLLLVLLFPALVRLATDWDWYAVVGFERVFLTSLMARITVMLVATGITFAFIYLNLRVALRGVVPELSVLRGPGTVRLDLNRTLRRISLPLSAGLAFLIGLGISADWLTWLKWWHRTPFGEVDPVFGRDVAYYVFNLPVVELVLALASLLTFLVAAMVVPLYVLRRDLQLAGRRVIVEPSAGYHLAGLVALIFLSFGGRLFMVDLPSLVYSTTGPLFGASHTDLAVRAPMLKLSGVLAFAAAAWVLWGARKGRAAQAAIAGALALVLVAGVGTRLVPAIYQRLVVLPNELAREAPQLEHHIAATQRAWQLDAVTVRDLTGEATLDRAAIEANEATISNVRLWDRDQLLQTFRQLQEIRTYYDFVAIDDDRYMIDGSYRQVLLSPRELNSQSLPQRTFINERLTFTHGMGLTLSPVNQVTSEGLPVLYVKDLPPASQVSLRVTRPGIYYGELDHDWVLVNTQQEEFDYPSGEGNVFTNYQGAGGVSVGGLFSRLMWSLRFQSLKILLSQDITSDSRVMLYRNIRERVSRALPFLLLDGDPYMVVTDEGHLVWILDGYTESNRYPYAQPMGGGTNYLRNSVKVVVDAYDGTVVPYLVDPEDPLVLTYQAAYPGIFRSMEEMPADIRAHLRYPDDLFRVQTALYTTYHMEVADVFYHREDEWQIPSITRLGQGSRDQFLRHMVMTLPGETQEEFIVMTPFTPRGKDNLAAWMVARMDRDRYGELVVYRFPRQSLVFGPAQIANRINQDTEISRQISLWDQRGSQVIFGNLLVIPIEEALIFVQAIYLQAEGGRIPELKRVVVAYQNQVVMEETLAQGLSRLFGTEGAPRRETTLTAPDRTETPLAAVDNQLVGEALQAYRNAVEAQQAGDWARYGEELRRLGEILERLN